MEDLTIRRSVAINFFLIDMDLCEVETSQQSVFLSVSVPIIYQEITVLFIGKNYSLFLFSFYFCTFLFHVFLIYRRNTLTLSKQLQEKSKCFDFVER